jgi:histidinol phosphatase-like PHP family hydrolase
MLRIAFFSDIHLDLTGKPPAGGREYDLVPPLIDRLVDRLNRFVRPDLVLLLGDLVDEGSSPDAGRHYEALRAAFDRLEAPRIVIPGNHDGPAFDGIFGAAPETYDLAGIRFLFFLDPEEPGYNARRLPGDIERMRRSRSGHAGPIVTVQHVPLFPPGTHECPYRYLNAEEIIATMREARITLALSGHYHPGIRGLCREGMTFHTVGALCERPFVFDVMDIEEGTTSRNGATTMKIAHESLLPHVPDGTRLTDFHVHTHFSYCGPTMEIGRTIAAAPRLGLDRVILTEHSGQLYFDSKSYWGGAWFEGGIADATSANRRIDDYLAATASVASDSLGIGLEADVDAGGKLVLDLQKRPGFVVGAVHRMKSASWKRDGTGTVDATVADEFLSLNEALARSGVDAIAHPFRILTGRAGIESLFAPMIEILRRYGVAAEINYHLNDPPFEFFARCIECGVKLTFGSDAHELWELGNFAPHLDLIRRIGFDGSLSDILLAGAP